MYLNQKNKKGKHEIHKKITKITTSLIGIAAVVFSGAVLFATFATKPDVDDLARAVAGIWTLVVYIPIFVYGLVKMIHSAVKHKPFKTEAILLASLVEFFVLFLILTSL